MVGLDLRTERGTVLMIISGNPMTVTLFEYDHEQTIQILFQLYVLTGSFIEF